MRNPKNEPTCPILNGDPIPMWLARLAYKRYSEKFRNGQSLNQIMQRGGFGIEEVLVQLHELKIEDFEKARDAVDEFYPGRRG